MKPKSCIAGLSAFLAFNLFPVVSCAGGSVGFERIERYLKEQPATYEWLSSTLVFPDDAFAEIRLGPQFKYLSAERMGPYTFEAEPKARTGSAKLEVIVCTDVRFLDGKGKEVPDVKSKLAHRIDEHLAAVLIRDAKPNPGFPLCPPAK